MGYSMKKIRVAINGFGRIGRQVFRAMHERYRDTAEIVAVNDLCPTSTNFHLLKYDSSYGQAAFDMDINGDTVTVGDWTVQSLSQRDPKALPWKDLDVDVVVESTGIFKTADQARVHVENGAKKIIITSPAKNEDITIVIGVNEDAYDPAKHTVISNASCTTNCLAPAAYVLFKEFGIAQGMMTTVHSYTNDQRILDLPHSDLRRARSAGLSIIPTTTGAAQAVAKVIPQLKGRFSGFALRVPTPTVSLVDFTAVLEKETDTETLRTAMKTAAAGPLKGILQYCEEPLVSMDFKGNSHSCIVDAEYTEMVSPNVAKLVCWYDNEWGYSYRVIDLVDLIRRKGV